MNGSGPTGFMLACTRDLNYAAFSFDANFDGNDTIHKLSLFAIDFGRNDRS